MISDVVRKLAVLGCLLATAAGCGGGGATGPTTPDGTPTGPVTADGTAVTEEALSAWQSANTRFAQFETQGWNAQRCESMIEAYNEANEAQGGRFPEALYMSGLVASRCNNLEQARDFYNRALQANARFCKARAAIGLAEMEAGRDQPAAAAFQQAIRDDNQCTEAYVNLAIIQRRAGGAQAREALNNLRRALAIDSNYLPAFNQMALLYLEQAEAQQNNQQMLDLAGVVCRQAQLIDNNYAPIFNTWGLVWVRKGEVRKALEMFARALSLDDDMFEAHMNFGQITLSFRGYEDAKNAFTRAVALQPRNYDAHIGLGVALRGLRQIDQAQAEYEAAIQIDGNRPEAFFNLGVLYQDYRNGTIDDLNRAKRYFEQFLEKAGQRPAFTASVESVRRVCQTNRPQGGRRRRRAAASTDCRPGRLRNIQVSQEALQAMEQMQRNNAGTPPATP